MLDYYADATERIAGICYKGHTFDGEPDGGEASVRIISRKEWEEAKKAKN